MWISGQGGWGHEAAGLWPPSRDFGAEQWIHLVLRAAEAEPALDEGTIHTWAEGRDSMRPHRSNSSEPERSSKWQKLGVQPVQAFHHTVRTHSAGEGGGTAARRGPLLSPKGRVFVRTRVQPKGNGKISLHEKGDLIHFVLLLLLHEKQMHLWSELS